ncbi:MAG: type II toxin-antitoxin system HicB family antitoxin [Pyrinomonadaceae bacterium MAG19_C2-C3]|nr:type II toxin-antitoxin system HicB family antitoxin [Pyrinomonadaceae bacterium MAG19_C2-C3]
MKYAVVVEWADGNYSAYSPDVAGCMATGDTIEETKRNFAEALEFHLAGLRADGEPVPEPSSDVDFIEIAA